MTYNIEKVSIIILIASPCTLVEKTLTLKGRLHKAEVIKNVNVSP